MTPEETQRFLSESVKQILKKQWEQELFLLENVERLYSLESVLAALDSRAGDLILKQNSKAHEENRKRREEIQSKIQALATISPIPPSRTN